MGNQLPTFGSAPYPMAVPNNSQVVIPQITLQQPAQTFQQIQPYTPVGPQLSKVHGMDGAKQFPTVANAVYALFDDSEDVLYIKATDKNNYPVMLKRFRYSEEEEVAPTPPEYVTKQDYDALYAEVQKMKEELANGKQPVQSAGSTQSSARKSDGK